MASRGRRRMRRQRRGRRDLDARRRLPCCPLLAPSSPGQREIAALLCRRRGRRRSSPGREEEAGEELEHAKLARRLRRRRRRLFFFFFVGRTLLLVSEEETFFSAENVSRDPPKTKLVPGAPSHNFSHLAAATPRGQHRRRGGGEEDGLLRGRAAEDERVAKRDASAFSRRASPSRLKRIGPRVRHLENPAGHRLERPQALYSLDHFD